MTILDYTLTDFISIFDTSALDKEKLPPSEVVYKVLKFKVEKILKKKENLSLLEAVSGLVCLI